MRFYRIHFCLWDRTFGQMQGKGQSTYSTCCLPFGLKCLHLRNGICCQETKETTPIMRCRFITTCIQVVQPTGSWLPRCRRSFSHPRKVFHRLGPQSHTAQWAPTRGQSHQNPLFTVKEERPGETVSPGSWSRENDMSVPIGRTVSSASF